MNILCFRYACKRRYCEDEHNISLQNLYSLLEEVEEKYIQYIQCQNKVVQTKLQLTSQQPHDDVMNGMYDVTNVDHNAVCTCYIERGSSVRSLTEVLDKYTQIRAKIIGHLDRK